MITNPKKETLTITLHEVISDVDARCEAGEITDEEFFATVRRDMAARIADAAADVLPVGAA